jgi:hypothetical protein
MTDAYVIDLVGPPGAQELIEAHNPSVNRTMLGLSASQHPPARPQKG